MKRYYYFVSYYYSEGAMQCFGNIEIYCAHPIKFMLDIMDCGREIQKKLNYDHIPTVLNYQLLRVVETEEREICNETDDDTLNQL